MFIAIGTLLGLVIVSLGVTTFSRIKIRQQREHIRQMESKRIATDERRRIAREFHDSLQQHLASAAVQLENVQTAIRTAPERVPELVNQTTAMVRHCQAEARHCIWDLRTEVLASQGLAAALIGWLRMRSASCPEVKLDFRQHGSPVPALTEEEALHLMRIAQEAVNNALRHGRPKQVRLALSSDSEKTALEICDDGEGFDVDGALRAAGSSYGLRSQQERAHKLGAQLGIASQPGRGTHVSVSMKRSKSFTATKA
jgi:signal transduction histidine kinase